MHPNYFTYLLDNIRLVNVIFPISHLLLSSSIMAFLHILLIMFIIECNCQQNEKISKIGSRVKVLPSVYDVSNAITTTTPKASIIDTGLQWLDDVLFNRKEEKNYVDNQQQCSQITYESRWEECDRIFQVSDHLESIHSFFASKCEYSTRENQKEEDKPDVNRNATENEQYANSNSTSSNSSVVEAITKQLTMGINRKYFRAGSNICVLVNFITIIIYLIVSGVIKILYGRYLRSSIAAQL